MAVAGVPIGTEEYVEERAVGNFKDGGADSLVRCLVDMPGEQATVLIAIESLETRTS